MKIPDLLKNYLNLKNIPISAVLVLILSSLFFVIFYSRQIFFFKYEPEYYENLYYHSQWNIPGSIRGISDGMLYKFVGYRLAMGENTFYLNYEAPPFGKYLYGLAELFLGNPYWVSLGLYLISVTVFWLLAKEIFGNWKFAAVTTLVLTTNPFLATQIRDTMLDLPLAAFYLLNIFFFVKYLQKPKWLFVALAGIFLGIATGTKIGIYTPPVILLSLGLIIWAKRNVIPPVVYLVSVGIGYGIAYISYFLKHQNPIPFIKLHEKQLAFYYNPDATVDYLNQWRGIFANTYQGWWGAGATSFGDWSLVLPLGTIAAFVVLILALRRKEKAWVYVSGLTIIFLLVNSFISFWPRYLMPIVPAFILLIAYFLRKAGLVLLILALLNLPFLYSSMVVKNYDSNAEAIGSFVAHRAYRELYRSIDPAQRASIPEDKFVSQLESFYETLKVRKIEVTPKNTVKTDKGSDTEYQIKYQTDFGELSFNQDFDFSEIHNQLWLDWKWDYLWPQYSPENKIIVEDFGLPIKEAQRQKLPFAIPGKAEKVYIITRHAQWPKTLDDLAPLTQQSGLEVAGKLRESIPDDFPRYIGMLDRKLGEEGRKKALDIKGVKLFETDYLVPAPGVDEQAVYGAVDGLAKSKPELLFTKADIYFEKNGNRVYILDSDSSGSGLVIDL